MYFWLPLVWLCVYLFLRHRRAQLHSARGKAVFVSGCDTGFGNATALRLAEMGVLVVRVKIVLRLRITLDLGELHCHTSFLY